MPQSLDLQLEQTDVFHSLVVVEVSFAQDGLLDADLLIEQRTFIITAKQLLAQTVTLSDQLERRFDNK